MSEEQETLDHPFYDVCARADKLIQGGATLFQKFSCVNCGNRLTMPDPNVFYKLGTCDKCDATTNIEETGCNYLLTIGVPDHILREALDQ